MPTSFRKQGYAYHALGGLKQYLGTLPLAVGAERQQYSGQQTKKQMLHHLLR